jgi:uncharacterized membrane protein YfcA
VSDIAATSLLLVAITFGAAVVNGALGYGFSSITVPLALLFTASRVLNPALVIVEVGLNFYVLAVNWRSAVTAARRVTPVVIGLVPGVVVGSFLLASISPDAAKLVTYTVLLPLILVQASGVRRPVRSERAVGVPLGAGVGLLYSVTTISGPPLALMLNNQGLARRDFRASLAVIRVAESSLTAIAYLFLGLYTPASLALIPPIVPAVILGVPLGAALMRRLDPETFRRVCMSFDAWIVGFGLSRTVESLHIVTGPSAYTILAATAITDLVLLYRFFNKRYAVARTRSLISATGGK